MVPSGGLPPSLTQGHIHESVPCLHSLSVHSQKPCGVWPASLRLAAGNAKFIFREAVSCELKGWLAEDTRHPGVTLLGESSPQEQRCAQGAWLCSQRTWPASDSQPLSEISLSGPGGSIALPSDIIPQTNPTRKEMWIVSINGVSGSWGETQHGVCCKRLHPAARKQKHRFSPLSSCPAD